MAIISRWSFVRLIVITALSAVLFGCGSENKSSPNDTSNQGGGGNNNGGGHTAITTGVHLLTSLCDTPRGCPLDEKPYRVKMQIEIQRPNGWIVITDANGIDTADLGDVTISLSAGTYRFKALAVQPITVRPAIANEAIVTVTSNVLTPLSIQFIPL